MQELRLYSFVNFYLSSIQQGVQTGHAAVDLVRKYTSDRPLLTTGQSGFCEMLVEEWADLFKTFIILNGGNAASIANASKIIEESGFPWVPFYEDSESLAGIQTCVAVILPENIFNARQCDPDSSGKEQYSYVYEDANGVPMTTYYAEGHPFFNIIKLVRTSRLAS